MPESISTERAASWDEYVELAGQALRRAALRVRDEARRDGTYVVAWRDGRVVREWPGNGEVMEATKAAK